MSATKMEAPLVLMPRWRCKSYIHNSTFYTHIDQCHKILIFLHAGSIITGKLTEWVMIDYDCCKNDRYQKF